MNRILFLVILALIVFVGGYWIKTQLTPQTTVESNHTIVLEKIEAMGKLQLVKYRYSDIIEHKNSTDFLPDASVLLIVKADAAGCIDLSKLESSDVITNGDSVHITLPKAEICYVKIDHQASKVYDTKMAFFREANLVDEAFKYAEKEMDKLVRKSDILEQTQNNALPILKPLLEGLGFQKISIDFK